MPDLSTDGWELESAEERNRAHPSFEIAPLEERSTLAPGTKVQLLFLFLNQENGQPIVDVERMWVIITEARDGSYLGQLDSEPASSTVIARGQIVAFGPEHIAMVMIPKTDPRHPDYSRSSK